MLTAQELYNLGLSNERRGAIDRALHFYSSIIVSWPQEMAPYHRLSVLALQRQDFSLALAWTDKAIAVNDSIAEIWNNRALALAQLGRTNEAERSFERAIAIRSDNWEGYYNLGRMFIVEKRFAEAEPVLQKAAELDPHSAPTWNNLGLVFHELYRYPEAIAAFDIAIELVPDYVEAISNKASSLYFAHALAESEALFRSAIAIAPQNAELHYGLGSVLLTSGKLQEGFSEHEWRWKSPEKPAMWNPNRPLWNGEPLAGRTLLLWPEQGLGDTIQFIRYLPDLAKMDCELLVKVPDELYRLFMASFSHTNVRFIHTEAKVPDFDLHVPLMSLPRILGETYEAMRMFKPYLRARGAEIDEWRKKLKSMMPPENRKKRRIGIAWSGSPKHPMDRNRSMTWETFQPVIDAHKRKFQFFSLQPGRKPEDPYVIDLGEFLRDYATTAAIVSNLDHIITVDTSLLHLASSMGKRTWAMLFHLPDWRWRIDDEQSPWYPLLLLIAQKHPGVWDDVIGDVKESLALE
ncbi:MAG TPA: tetratricopeptide repeat protein [Candidatus Kapabacteria bacterium]|jgi:tetratricopeptide (TPR) repeat protein